MRKLDQVRIVGRRLHRAALVVAGACAAAALVASHVSFIPLLGGAYWPPAAIALIGVLILGYRTAPAAFVGTTAGMMLTGTEPRIAFVAALTITVQAISGAWMASRFAAGAGSVMRTRPFVKFVATTGVAAAAVGPVVGFPALALIGRAPESPAAAAALLWWVGGFVDTLVLAPLFLVWITERDSRMPGRGRMESSALAASLAICWIALLGGHFSIGVAAYPIALLCMPTLLWAAYRFGPRIATLATLGFASVALAGTRGSFGPFAVASVDDSLAGLQAFVGVVALTTIVIAILTGERRAAEHHLTRLAQTDGLTGLVNYRTLIDALSAEVSRSMRHGQAFAVLMIDLNRLKEINDTLGHLVGNSAIVRVAEALRSTCRAVDTASRIGGDEFCVVLSGATERDTRLVVERLNATLASAVLGPRVTISTGVALYPRDGATVDQLMEAADAALYRDKLGRVPRLHERTRVAAVAPNTLSRRA